MAVNMLTKYFPCIYIRLLTLFQWIDTSKVSYVDYICGWNQYVMKLLGIWPEERKINKISSYVVLITASIMTVIITIPQMINLFIVWGDLNLVVENLTLSNMTVSIALFKTIAFWWNGRSLKILLSSVEENRKQSRNQEEMKRMMEIAKICRMLSVCSIIFIILLVASTCFVRIWMNHYTGRALIMSTDYPFETNTSPNYEFIIAAQLFAGGWSCMSYTMVDLFLAMLVFHTCGQLENLKARFHNLKSKLTHELQAALTDIIKTHNALYKFVETIENLFNHMLLIQMLGCTILLCIQSFQTIVTITGQSLEIVLPQLVFFVSYIAYILLQLYLYCYIGEKLYSESMSIIDAAYECKWYDLSPSKARPIILVMVRAHTPLCLTAGKFCFLNHELFSTILKSSMSYLSVLYAMKINDEE